MCIKYTQNVIQYIYRLALKINITLTYHAQIIKTKNVSIVNIQNNDITSDRSNKGKSA